MGLDYSGAGTSASRLPGLRLYEAPGASPPAEVPPPPGAGKRWTRRGLAEWLAQRLTGPETIAVGIDHAFSFPLAYFDLHGVPRHWPAFLDDFHRHWPTDGPDVSVEHVRRGVVGHGAARGGDAHWRRLTDRRARAKSAFHFDVPGSVAKSTHAGLPWLRYLRRAVGHRAHFWPFDGWRVPPARSLIAEVYPALWSRRFPRAGRTADQHDAFSICAWLQRSDRDGTLAPSLEPRLSADVRALAHVEGWILGVPGDV